MPILNFQVSTYARNIYLLGVTTLNYVQTNFPNYYEPVERYAATGIVNNVHYPSTFNGYTDAQLNNALTQGWITQQEYNETISYRI